MVRWSGFFSDASSERYRIKCYLDVREALTNAKELLMKQEPDERLVVGTAYCGQNLRTGEMLELVPS